MKRFNKTIGDRLNSFGEWILARRPNGWLMSILLLTLYTGAIINLALLAWLLLNCGTIEKIVACILFVIDAGALFWIYYEFFDDGESFFSLESIWSTMKFQAVMILSGACYLVLFGFITIYAAQNLLGTQQNGTFSPYSNSAFIVELIFLGMAALLLYSIYAFKREKPRAVSFAVILLTLTMLANIVNSLVNYNDLVAIIV